MNSYTKEQLITHFQQMKDLESGAHNYYMQVFEDDLVKDEKFKDIFKQIADQETEHADLVQQIINMINNNL